MICERSVKKYCKEFTKVENYDKAIVDETQTWDAHHRLESCFTQKFLKEMGLYYNVEPEALIFLTKEEHRKIDSKCKRISEANKGRPAHNKRKVKCVETGEIFDSACDASRKTGIRQNCISMVCNGKLKTTGGFHWKFL